MKAFLIERSSYFALSLLSPDLAAAADAAASGAYSVATAWSSICTLKLKQHLMFRPGNATETLPDATETENLLQKQVFHYATKLCYDVSDK